MIPFQIVIVIIVAFCLGRLFKFMDYIRKAPDEITTRTVLAHTVRAIYSIIIAIAAIFIYILLELIVPIIQ